MSRKCPACGFALGGEIPRDADLGPKKDAELPAIDDPEYQLDVYRGENAKRKAEEAAAKKAAEQAQFAQALKRRSTRRTQ